MIIPKSSQPEKPTNRKKSGQSDRNTLFLLPTVNSDIKIKAYNNEGREMTCNIAPAIAATHFLISVRGLPLSEVEIEADEGIYNAQIDLKSQGVYLILPKPKLKTNAKAEIFDVEISYSLISTTYGTVAITECEDAELYDMSALRLLSERAGRFILDEGLSEYSGDAVAYSYIDGGAKIISSGPYSADSRKYSALLAVAWKVLSAKKRGNQVKIVFNNCAYYFSLLDERIAVFSPAFE